MGRRKDSLLDTLMASPWWISAVLAIAAYVGLRFVFPHIGTTNSFLRGVAHAAPSLAPMAAVIFGFAALFSSLRYWNRRRLLDSQSSIEEIRKLDWQDFERLVGEAFRRRGYTVQERGLNGPDGGVDLELHRGTEKVLVQCKHWRTWKVGVSPVRELYGVMAAEGAREGIFVTSGQYTREALQFARDNGLKLFDGPDLMELISTVQGVASASRSVSTFRNSIPVLVSLAIIVGFLWHGTTLPKQELLRMNIPSRPSETTNPHSNVAPLSTPGPERDAEAQHEELAARARGLFESSYIPPSDCDNWKSHEHMLDCGNQRIRAKRLFLEQHPEFAAITEIDLQ